MEVADNHTPRPSPDFFERTDAMLQTTAADRAALQAPAEAGRLEKIRKIVEEELKVRGLYLVRVSPIRFSR
jgi:hypothetical protein